MVTLPWDRVSYLRTRHSGNTWLIHCTIFCLYLLVISRCYFFILCTSFQNILFSWKFSIIFLLHLSSALTLQPHSMDIPLFSYNQPYSFTPPFTPLSHTTSLSSQQGPTVYLCHFIFNEANMIQGLSKCVRTSAREVQEFIIILFQRPRT